MYLHPVFTQEELLCSKPSDADSDVNATITRADEDEEREVVPEPSQPSLSMSDSIEWQEAKKET